ncbi:MAG TPA: peptidoglycan DD-metalloendopeptidase family protein [Candidatus Dormibacteraeota bacterium]|nr:peptidoglycan DD-metalloendopeptidase family protein [Candidatus Dormibacteraeota bacterium]
MRRRKSGARRMVILTMVISGLGVAGIAMMAAYDDAHSVGAQVSGGPPHNPMPPPDLLVHFQQAATAHHVPISLLLAVGAEESGYRPDAQSGAGALGVMQMLPATFAAYAPTGAQASDIWNPAVEIDAAAAMLAADGAAAGDSGKALLAYNHDPAYVAEVEARAAAYQEWIDDGRPGPDAALPWPVIAPVTQPFGCTGVSLEPSRGGCAHFHTGIDLGAPSGTAVGSSCPGTITQAVDGGSGFGIHVVVSCDLPGVDYSALYGHLSSRVVEVGDRVALGQVIGYVGSTGNSSGPHLHFEIDTPSGPADPAGYLASA